MNIERASSIVLGAMQSRCVECVNFRSTGWTDVCSKCPEREAYKVADEVFKAAAKYAWHTDPTDVPDADRKVECRTVTKAGKVNAVFGYYADGRWCCGMNSNVIKWREVEE